MTVAFLEAIPTKRWGDRPFKVRAKADNGAMLSYTAKGDCAVGKSTGLVEIRSAGSCTVSAQTASGPRARAALTFAIRRATPKIQFGDQTVRYTRTLAYRVKVKVTPDIDLVYRVIQETSDPECRIKSGRLTLVGVQPNLTASCTIEVSAARASADYVTPSAIRANIKVDFPAWDVDATSPDVVHWSTDGALVTVTVRENSGNAFGIDVEQNGGAGECFQRSTSPSDPPAGTTVYRVVLEVQEPSTADGYVCNMTAKGSPPDYYDPGGKSSDDFTVTVLP